MTKNEKEISKLFLLIKSELLQKRNFHFSYFRTAYVILCRKVVSKSYDSKNWLNLKQIAD